MQLLLVCADWVAERTSDEKFSIALLYARHAATERNVLENFFPFALTASFEPVKNASTNNERRRELNNLIANLTPICQKLRSIAKILQEHLEARLRHTPLLLPPRNFREAVITETLAQISHNALDCVPLERHIKDRIAMINGTVKRARARDELHYVNGAGVLFRAPPANAFHGFGRRNEEHPPGCYLRARTRLGSSYNPEFHYDCEPISGTIRGVQPSCHTSVEVQECMHLNIAPNDFIRSKYIVSKE
jgi:hypothetical protein